MSRPVEAPRPVVVITVESPNPQSQPIRVGSDLARVLVVEDDLDQLRLIDIYLRRAGCSVEPAVSAEQAVDLVDRGEEFDLAIVDVNLPGMSGVQFASLLRRRRPRCRVVLTSVLERADIGSGELVLPKPYSRAHLVALLESSQMSRPMLPEPRPCAD